jgi:hypothetical protein
MFVIREPNISAAPGKTVEEHLLLAENRSFCGDWL